MTANKKPDTMIIDGTDASFVQDVVEASNDMPVLVDFWAPWCGPCKTLKPMLERLVAEQNGKVKLVKVNTEEHQGIAGQLRVMAIPMVFAFKDGKPVDAFKGALPESKVLEFIETQKSRFG